MEEGWLNGVRFVLWFYYAVLLVKTLKNTNLSPKGAPVNVFYPTFEMVLWCKAFNRICLLHQVRISRKEPIRRDFSCKYKSY